MLIKSFDPAKIRTSKNTLVENNKKSLLNIQLLPNNGNNEQDRSIRSLFPNIKSNIKGNFVDIFA